MTRITPHFCNMQAFVRYLAIIEALVRTINIYRKYNLRKLRYKVITCLNITCIILLIASEYRQVKKVRQEMKTIIQVSGKARQVFKYMELLNRYKGNTTLKELAKKNKTINLKMQS